MPRLRASPRTGSIMAPSLSLSASGETERTSGIRRYVPNTAIAQSDGMPEVVPTRFHGTVRTRAPTIRSTP